MCQARVRNRSGPVFATGASKRWPSRSIADVPSRRTLQIWTAAGVVILDQIVKLLIRARLGLYESMTVIPGFIDLTRVHNTGTAFGFMNLVDFPFKTVVVALMAATALAALAIYGSTLAPEQRLSRVGLSLVVGGAAGNLVDRLA